MPKEKLDTDNILMILANIDTILTLTYKQIPGIQLRNDAGPKLMVNY